MGPDVFGSEARVRARPCPGESTGTAGIGSGQTGQWLPVVCLDIRDYFMIMASKWILYVTRYLRRVFAVMNREFRRSNRQHTGSIAAVRLAGGQIGAFTSVRLRSVDFEGSTKVDMRDLEASPISLNSYSRKLTTLVIDHM
ncbi:hypothetical protein [Oryza sativa Japonica Group]|uniref:Uncharacterized protein n=1 Tax=Oryza sativa subsp. japonica TaxID=39947 RepID=Q5N9B8_ORYSJ|nr:hypothetical protein [Oryza sativa Japonica Group]